MKSVRQYFAFASRRYCAERFVLLPAVLAALCAVIAAVGGRSMIHMAPMVCVQLDIFADYRIFGGLQGTDMAGMKFLRTSPRGREFLRNVLIVDLVFRFLSVAGTVGVCFLADQAWAAKPFCGSLWGLGYLILTACVLSAAGTWIARFGTLFWGNLWAGSLGCGLEAVCCVFLIRARGVPALDMMLAAAAAGVSVLAVKTAMNKTDGLPPAAWKGRALKNIKLGVRLLRYGDGPQNSVLWAFIYLMMGLVLSFLGKLLDRRVLPGEIFLALAAVIPGQCIYSFGSSGVAQAAPSRRQLQTWIPAAVTVCFAAAVYLAYSLINGILLMGEPGYREAVCAETAGLAGWLAFMMILIAVVYKFPRMSVFVECSLALLYSVGKAEGWLQVSAGGPGAFGRVFLTGLAVILLGDLVQYGLSRLLYKKPAAG